MHYARHTILNARSPVMKPIRTSYDTYDISSPPRGMTTSLSAPTKYYFAGSELSSTYPSLLPTKLT